MGHHSPRWLHQTVDRRSARGGEGAGRRRLEQHRGWRNSRRRRNHDSARFGGQDPETVMLHFVEPAGAGGRTVDERGLARANEAGQRDASPPGRRSAPGYVSQVAPGTAVAANRSWPLTALADRLSPRTADDLRRRVFGASARWRRRTDEEHPATILLPKCL